MTDETFGARLRLVRQKWGFTQDELATKAGVGVATIRRAENGYFEPRQDTARKLADALKVRAEWLLGGDSDVMVLPVHMTTDEQVKARTPAGSGHPDTVLIVGPGPWYMDDDGEWQVAMSAEDNDVRRTAFSDLPGGEWASSPSAPIGEVFGDKWVVWGYNQLEEIQRHIRLEAMTHHPDETHLWYRGLTLYYVAQDGSWDLSAVADDRKAARTVQMDLLGLGLSSTKVAIDALLAGYYSPAYATIRHMLETVLQWFYLEAFPDRAYLWTTPPTGENIKRMGAKRMHDKLLGYVKRFEPESDRQAFRDFIEEVYLNWELLSTGSHPSGSGLSQVISSGSMTKRQFGGAYDRYMTLLGFDHGFFAMGELLSIFVTTNRVDEGWQERLAGWNEDVARFREQLASDPEVIKANANWERLRGEQAESNSTKEQDA